MHNPPENDLVSIARQGGRLNRMAVRTPTYPADVKEKNPAWRPMSLLVRTMPLRRLHWFATKRLVAHPEPGQSMFAGTEYGAVVDALRTDGHFPGLTLPKITYQEIAEFARNTGCFGNSNRRIEFVAPELADAEARFGRPLLSGHFFERSLDCAAVIAVQRDPLLADIARHYLGGQAQVITPRVWWSFPTQGSEADRSLASHDKYHFDVDDWRMLKFFFNLVDVDEGTGPHLFVKGSHRRRRIKHQLTLHVRHPAEEVLGFYGKGSVVTLMGKAGFGFVEDPFGFHICSVPTQKPRLMMEVGFGISKPSRRRFHGEPVLR